MGGENWETRLGRSRAGLLQSPRTLYLQLLEPYNVYVLSTRFGAPWNRNLNPYLSCPCMGRIFGMESSGVTISF